MMGKQDHVKAPLFYEFNLDDHTLKNHGSIRKFVFERPVAN